MAGILDYQRNINFAPMQLDASSPTLPPRGILDSIPDVPQGRAPLSSDQRNRVLFAALSDAISSLQGRQGGLTERTSSQFDKDNAQQASAQRRNAINQAIQTAISQGDMQGARAAIMQADPADVAHITSALTFGKPTITNSPEGDNVYSTDPFTGVRTQIQTGTPKPPQHRTIQRGLTSVDQQFDDKTGLWRDIPGAFGPKFAPGQPKALNPNAPVNLGPHPSSGY